MRAIFGADEPESGDIYLRGSDRPARIHSPRDAVRCGIALLTENRKEQGLLLPLSVRINATLAGIMDLVLPGGWIPQGRERNDTRQLIDMLDIRCRSTEQTAETLSGGNQQKLVIARWLYRNCDIMLFDEPTRGIDVGAKFDIYGLMNDLASEGKGVVMVSSDLKELMAVCDRIAVMSNGHVARIFERDEYDREDIMAAALSEYGGDREEAAQ
jgi:ribose transport system ATP-binding protein